MLGKTGWNETLARIDPDAIKSTNTMRFGEDSKRYVEIDFNLFMQIEEDKPEPEKHDDFDLDDFASHFVSH